MRRIAPQATLPEFYVEAGYLSDLLSAWKFEGRDPDGLFQTIDVTFLVQWYTLRQTLVRYRSRFGAVTSREEIVKACLRFVDALVADWLKQLANEKPLSPIDDNRRAQLAQHWHALNDIPGERMQIWY